MLNVHLEVVIDEVTKVLKKLTSELEFGGQGKRSFLLEHFPCIGVNKLPPVVPLNELFSHRKVFILHGYHSQLAFNIIRPVDSLSLLLELMFQNRLMIRDTNLCTRGHHIRIDASTSMECPTIARRTNAPQILRRRNRLSIFVVPIISSPQQHQ